jgi:hypothetical protein
MEGEGAMWVRRLLAFVLAVGCSVAIVVPAWSFGPPTSLSLHIWKGRREMILQRGDHVVRRFRVVLGSNPKDDKLRRGDGRTPEGRYFISEKKPHSPFHRFLAINYPNYDDAERALRQHLITGNEWADIFFANLRRTTPPASTPLGGRVGIHGFGNRPLVPLDWTEGCIAVSNDDIDYLYSIVSIGTPVVIER